ncbi:MAG: ABC transporter ATP-binding protein [Clostridia bacterium]|nr:ABC transporter ATP-binding protein [Clostridia bacterium]
MDETKPLINKAMPDDARGWVQHQLFDGEKLLFAVVGDLSLFEKYAAATLLITSRRAVIVDPNHENGFFSAAFSDIEKVSVKRMYGNARMNFKLKDGEEKTVFRYTYAVADLCDVAAAFIEAVGAGGDIEAELEAVKAAYEKKMRVCPKCGRTLIRPGAECIKCQSKGKIISKLFKYVKPQGALLIIALIMSMMSTALALLPPTLTQRLVDDVLPNSKQNDLIIIVLILLCSYVIGTLLNGFRGYMLRIAGDRIVRYMRNDVYEKAQHLPMKFYDKTSTGSVINRISGDTNTLQAFALRISQEIVVQLFMLVGIIIIMFVKDWKLSLLALCPVPIVVIGAKYFSRKIAPFYRRIWKRWAAVSSVLTDTIPCVRVVKSFAGEDRAAARFRKYNEEWYKVDTSSAKITTSFPAIVSFVVTCGSLLIWGVGGTWVIKGSGGLTPGLLVAFLSYVSMFYGPVNFFAYLSDSYQGALSSAERVLDILDAEPEHDFGKGNCPEKIEGKIEFRNVNFSFDRAKKTLSDINLTIEPGDIVGIVGTTGSGKSTLINLLMRFYDNYEGEILLDGQNIKDIDMSYYRSKIGYVQQEPMMFSDTIFNNIAYGVPDAHVEQVINAADVANAHDFIILQPDGYDSMLGERGVGLSGGERQRISIARAVLKNPSILVFDEATASVDSETENQIQEAIERLIYGRTTLMIAHRLSTLRKANKIVVVDKGRIIECGTHDELMALKGKFYRLIQIQSMSEQVSRQKAEENLE